MAAGATTTPTTGDVGGRRQDSPAADEGGSINQPVVALRRVAAGFSFEDLLLPAARMPLASMARNLATFAKYV